MIKKKWTPKKKKLTLQVLQDEAQATEFLIKELRRQKENKSEPPLDDGQKQELRNLYAYRKRVKELKKRMREVKV